MGDQVASNGWTAVLVDASKIFHDGTFRKPDTILINGIEFPSDPLVLEVQAYAKDHLPSETYNHSMRVFYFGMTIIQQQFPQHADTFSPSTLALTALLHDIGATKENLAATHMSFEFYGGIKTLNLLQTLGGGRDQVEAVCEAIIRHQDLGTDGTITFLGQVIQLATIYDNVSSYPTISGFDKIIHERTREDVIRAFPRTGWLACFSKVLKEEERLKPWCHTTHIPDFESHVLSNQLMRPYE